MFRRRKETRTVVFLGVGGVGKTTYIYRVLGITKQPRVTRRPGVYQLVAGNTELYLVDTPGQYAAEVARRYYEAIKTFGTRLDLIIYMYSVVDPETYHALWDIEMWVSRYPPHRKIVAGNKMGLVVELGYMTEGEDAVKWLNATRIYYVSALKDDPQKLLAIIAENLGLPLP
jgi:GTP-binding protein EngB required for normal cell division